MVEIVQENDAEESSRKMWLLLHVYGCSMLHLLASKVGCSESGCACFRYLLSTLCTVAAVPSSCTHSTESVQQSALQEAAVQVKAATAAATGCTSTCHQPWMA